MKRLLLVFCALTIPVVAQSPFDGTWQLNPQTATFKTQGDKFQLQNGMWNCDTCVPKEVVKADGQPHKVTGSPYYEMESVREINDHTVELTQTKNGKVVGTNKLTASEDGKTLSAEFTFTTEGGQQGNGTGVWKRAAEAPPGANKVSGTWKPEKLASASDNMMTFTYKTTADGLAMNDGTGDSYEAKFDGKDYPYRGDPGVTSVSLKKLDANTIEETDKRNGKVITVSRSTVSPDGKTMKVVVEDKLRNSTSDWVAKKQ
jgi:hypothetical protein